MAVLKEANGPQLGVDNDAKFHSTGCKPVEKNNVISSFHSSRLNDFVLGG